MQEIKILQKLDHPNVLKLYEYFIDDENIYLITEMCRGGELFDKIIEKEFFEEKEAAKLFRQILLSLNYIHSQGIAHRDIKPENFLFESKDDDSSLKIIDFGLSKILSKSGKTDANASKRQKLEALGKMKTKAGTPSYVSPEVLAGNYHLDCDMWSAGCMLFILLSGYPPFEGDSDLEICQSIMKGKVDFDCEEWEDISKEAKHFIGQMICKPEKRLTAEEALKHKWFKKVLPEAFENKAINMNCVNYENFKNFEQNTEMKQAALTAISVNVSPEDIKELKDLFLSLDVNGDGSLTIDEL